MPAPDPNRTSVTDPDPSKSGALSGLIVVLVVALFTKLGLPLDAETKTWILIAIGGAGPIGTALAIRLKSWAPSSVAKAQGMWMQLTNEMQSQNPPPVVTNEPMTLAEASEVHPGTLGFHGIEERADPAEPGSANTAQMGSFLGFGNEPRTHRRR